jgi:putative redox protein
MTEMRDAHSATAAGPYQQAITVGPHHLVGDEGADKGGQDTGPTPHELLLAALATCTSMTMKAYAQHKGLPLRQVHVTVRGRHDNGVFVIDKEIQLDGDLDEVQRARILEIGGRCPVAKTLSGQIRIVG